MDQNTKKAQNWVGENVIQGTLDDEKWLCNTFPQTKKGYKFGLLIPTEKREDEHREGRAERGTI